MIDHSLGIDFRTRYMRMNKGCNVVRMTGLKSVASK